ncbi:MAG: rRNA adenine N(6)-methyltransferase family protein [Actinomycetota bacterium]|nr:rRNA adenine N(6)-methyltransferase family protein [Actinomycetota bacterium]
MRNSESGRHELAQNFLVDRLIVVRVVDLVAKRPGLIVEWGTGDGAITLGLNDLERPLQGIEIDRNRALKLSRKVGPHVCISEGDILRHAPPTGAVIVSNVPFHLTTPILRHLLASRGWSAAVLITQWEVARKRAGVGGTTQLTVQWWPWYSFTLDRRISSNAFRPRPSVDAGLLIIDRRSRPLVANREQARYADWVARVFGSRGRGMADIFARNGVPRTLAEDLARKRSGRRGPTAVLPRDLRAEDWAAAYAARHRA